MESDRRKQWQVFSVIAAGMCGFFGGLVFVALGYTIVGQIILFVTLLAIAAYLVFSI